MQTWIGVLATDKDIFDKDHLIIKALKLWFRKLIELSVYRYHSWTIKTVITIAYVRYVV